MKKAVRKHSQRAEPRKRGKALIKTVVYYSTFKSENDMDS